MFIFIYLIIAWLALLRGALLYCDVFPGPHGGAVALQMRFLSEGYRYNRFRREWD